MSGSIDQWAARMDRELERVMKMSIEEIAAEEGKTVEQVLEEGRQIKERILACLRARGAKV
jgi:hypothetical protein